MVYKLCLVQISCVGKNSVLCFLSSVAYINRFTCKTNSPLKNELCKCNLYHQFGLVNLIHSNMKRFLCTEYSCGSLICLK